MSDWQEIWSGIPQGFILGPVLFNTFINYLDVGLKGEMIKSTDDKKLGGTADSLEDRIAIQINPAKLDS